MTLYIWYKDCMCRCIEQLYFTLDVSLAVLPNRLDTRESQARPATLLVASLACRLAEVLDGDLFADLRGTPHQREADVYGDLYLR